MTDQAVIYYGSQGAQVVGEMHLSHLANAIFKIERQGPRNENHANLAKIKAIYDRRKAEWDAANPPEAQS